MEEIEAKHAAAEKEHDRLARVRNVMRFPAKFNGPVSQQHRSSGESVRSTAGGISVVA